MNSPRLVRFLSLMAIALATSGCIGVPADGTASGVACGIVCFEKVEAGKQVDLGSFFLTSDALAQSFKLRNLGAKIRSASVRLKMQGGTFSASSGQKLTLSIHDDLGGTPGNVYAGTSQEFDLSLLGASEQYVTFRFPTPVSLLAGTYWLVLTPTYAVPNTTYVQWMANDTLLSGFADGVAKYRANGAWQSGALGAFRDLVFALN